MKIRLLISPHILKKLFFRGILPVVFALIFIVSSSPGVRAQRQLPPNIQVENIKSDKIIDAFLKVVDRYETLKKYNITLVQSRINSSTMQAQPVYNWNSFFKGIKSYQVKVGKFVRDSDNIRVEDLSEDVLIGWFA
ncbi:MAG: hypothetical protein RJQ14_11980, partial [Marinoscillum sp.]